MYSLANGTLSSDSSVVSSVSPASPRIWALQTSSRIPGLEQKQLQQQTKPECFQWVCRPCRNPVCVSCRCADPVQSPSSQFCLLEVTDSQYMPHTSAWRSFTLCPSFWVHGCEQPPSPIINWFSHISIATVKISASPLVRNKDWP